MSEREPKPSEFINPFHLPQEEMIRYMRTFNESFVQRPEGGAPFFKGSRPLVEMIKQRIVGVGAVLRISYGGNIHRFFIVTTRGLVDQLNPREPIRSFEDILDFTGVSGELDHWNFEGHELIGKEEDIVGTEGFGPPTSSM